MNIRRLFTKNDKDCILEKEFSIRENNRLHLTTENTEGLHKEHRDINYFLSILLY